MTRTTHLLAVAVGLGLTGIASAAVINVPTDFVTIQQAINAANPGDEIIVAPNTYPGNINMKGKAITLRSSDGPLVTIIDANQNGECINCVQNETSFTVIRGFTFQNGLTEGGAGSGGAINVLSNPSYVDCIFRDNTSEDGGGMYNFGASPSLTNCLFYNNTAVIGGRGGAMYNNFANPLLRNCTFTGNTGVDGGAIYNLTGLPRLFNCISWGNTGGEFGGPDLIVATYSNVPETIEGDGNITADPLFVDAAVDDYRLDDGSPCIDRGDSTIVAEQFFEDLGGEPRGVNDPFSPERGVAVFAITVDIGAYEYQVEGGGNDTCPADIDNSNEVDFQDLLLLLFNWGPCL